MTLISKTIKIGINQEKWLESHPEINFSEWVRDKISDTITQEEGANQRNIKAIIVAAGHDKRLGVLSQSAPKCLLDVKGKTILERSIENLRSCGVTDITIVKGYRQELINLPNIKYYINNKYEENGIVESLFTAEKELDEDFIFLYSDILYGKKLLEKLLKNTSDICLAIDIEWNDRYQERRKQPNGETELIEVKNKKIIKIGKHTNQNKAHGEFIGLAKFSKKGASALKTVYTKAQEKYKNKKFHEAKTVKKAYFTDIIQELIDNNIEVNYIDTLGDWMEIDSFEDYQKAWVEAIV